MINNLSLITVNVENKAYHYGRAGQNVWVRTSVNPTWLTIGGYR